MTSAERLAGGIDAFIDLVGRATSWLALGARAGDGRQCAAALRLLDRLDLDAGAGMAHHGADLRVRHVLCAAHGEHVRVDVLFQYFSPRNKHLVDVITAICCRCCSRVIVIWLCIPYVWQSWSIGEGTANPGGIDYRYIVKALIPIGFALFFMQSLSEAIKSYYRVAERTDAFDRNSRRPDAGVVLRPADGRNSGRADAGDLRFRVRLSRLRHAAVQSAAAPASSAWSPTRRCSPSRCSSSWA